MSSGPGETAASAIELWGGIECTVARIGETYRNEIVETGHSRREADLALIARLGIRTLRYPVIWETIAPDHPEGRDWRWHDRRLGCLRDLGVAPIAGLVHHGSGPRYTGLLDPAFPALLASHAAAVAERYPWITRFTPVNEPLTTARFSALYGHWYPHARNDGSFLRALVNQCRAVILSMEAIRQIIPNAQLVQTEDLGKTFSSGLLGYQAEHENTRRWLSFDLLCGRVDRHHPWYHKLLSFGIAPEELAFFCERSCPPDILGVNHYLTSERYLDERRENYPSCFWGGNGRHEYADVEAVRMPLPPAVLGPEERLREVWQRYGIPVVVTEAHHGSTRDEQLRWLAEVWAAAGRLAQEGADIRAVTMWSLFGAIDWNTLLTCRAGSYEPGAFDVRSARPRPTALSAAAVALGETGRYDHPVLDGPGWWHRNDRFYAAKPSGDLQHAQNKRHVLITGAGGTLGRAFARVCDARGLHHVALSRAQLDIADPQQVASVLADLCPWAVINAAGYVRVAAAEQEPAPCMRGNVDGARVVAAACAEQGVALVSFSSDRVFDGTLGRAHLESDPVCPACTYGRSKAMAEESILTLAPAALVIRTSAFFGPWDEYNFAHVALRELAAGRPLRLSAADVVSPTYVPDLVHAVLDLLIDGERGIWHLANQGAASWYELADWLRLEAGLTRSSLIPVPGERRSRALSSERALLLPPLEQAMERYFAENEFGWKSGACGMLCRKTSGCLRRSRQAPGSSAG